MQGATLPTTHASLSPPHPTIAGHRSTSAGHRPTPLSPPSPPRAGSPPGYPPTPSAAASTRDDTHSTQAAHGGTQEGAHSGTTHSGITHSDTPGDERYYAYYECRTSVKRDLGVITSGSGAQRDLGATTPADPTQEAAPQVPPPLPPDRSAGYHPASSEEETPVYIGWGGATGGPVSLLRSGRDARGARPPQAQPPAPQHRQQLPPPPEAACATPGALAGCTTQGEPPLQQPLPAASPRASRPATAPPLRYIGRCGGDIGPATAPAVRASPAEGARPEPTRAKVILHQEVRQARTPSPDPNPNPSPNLNTITLTLTLNPSPHRRYAKART